MGGNRLCVQPGGIVVNYTITLEDFGASYVDLGPLYRTHYGQMCERLEADGIVCSPYKPRLDAYAKASKEKWLLTFVLRCEGNAVGYSNIYVTNDMHNGDLIAQEDTIYVLPEHRKGAGRMLIKAVHEELKRRGVKRLNVTTMTDLRVSKLLSRMGYQHVAHAMTLKLKD